MTKFDTLISETPSIKEYIYPIRYINLNAFLIISIQSLTNYFHYLYACIFDLSGRDNKNRRQTKYFSSPRSFSWCFSRCARSRKKKIYKKKGKRRTFVEEDAEYWVKGVLVIVRGTGNETNRCRTVDVKNEKMIVRKF